MVDMLLTMLASVVVSFACINDSLADRRRCRLHCDLHQVLRQQHTRHLSAGALMFCWSAALHVASIECALG